MNLSPPVRYVDTHPWGQNHPAKLLPNPWPTRSGGNLLQRNRKLPWGTTEHLWAKQGHYESGILPGYLGASSDQVARCIFDLQSTNPEEPAAPDFVGRAGSTRVVSVGPQQTILDQLCTFSNQMDLLKGTPPEDKKKIFRLQTSRAQLSLGKGQLTYDASEERRKTSPTWPGDAMQP